MLVLAKPRMLGREIVVRFSSAFFPVEVKKAGIVAIVGLLVEKTEPAVDVLPVQQRLQLTVGFDATIFANT